MTVVLTSFFQSFKTTKSFWCFVFVTLFNLQGTHRANLSRRICILAHPFPFVKSFFQVFSNFFQLSHSPGFGGFRAVLADSFDRIPQAVLFVNTFFQVFSNFFRCSPEATHWFSLRRKALAYISKPSPLCQHLFSTFFSFFSTSFSTTISATFSSITATRCAFFPLFPLAPGELLFQLFPQLQRFGNMVIDHNILYSKSIPVFPLRDLGPQSPQLPPVLSI